MRASGTLHRLTSLVVLTLLLPACAASERPIDLPLPEVPSGSVASPSRGPRVALGRVEDVRRFERIAEHRDREGKLRWRGVPGEPLEDWLRVAIGDLLRTRGIVVTDTTDTPDLTLDLRLREALVDTRRDRRRAEVALLAWLRCARDGRVLALAPLRGRARQARTAGTSDGSTLLAALDRAVDDLVTELAACPRCSAEEAR